MPGIAYTLGLDASKGIAGLSAMRSAFSGFAGMVGKLGPLLGFAGGLGIIGGAAAGMKKAIDEAANMETMQTGFKVLLGGVSQAQARMAELANFAKTTPFELPEVVAASRTLQTLTKGALATGDGLTLAGDVASATNQPFADIAVTIGRLYDGLQSGRPVGEAMARLQELGTISVETRAKIEALQASGKKGGAVWSLAARDLGQFAGMMDQQSGTWSGMMSNLKDSINAAFREFGSPVMFALKPLLREGIGLADRLANLAREAGEHLAGGIALVREAFTTGQLGELAGLSLKVGFGSAVVALSEGLLAAVSGFGSSLENTFSGVAGGFVASMEESVARSLADLTFFGRPVFAPEDAAHDIALAQKRQEEARAMINPRSFIGGLQADQGEAMAQLKNLVATLQARITGESGDQPLNGGLGAPPQQAGLLASASAAMNTQRIEPLSDRLAKIGLFVGGSGGPRGEKAQQDTAKNTASIARLIAEQTQKFERYFLKTTGATF